MLVTTLKTRFMKQVSVTFMLLAIVFNVCLIASNFFAAKLMCIGGFVTFSASQIIFPISYIVNDCICEVYGYRKTLFVIWTGFAMNLFVVLAAQVVLWLPAAGVWGGQESFSYVFHAAPVATVASLLAFLAGSSVNALVMSRMKVADKGRRFASRAILSSVVGDITDSAIFVPILFWSLGLPVILVTMACEVASKLVYEALLLPFTAKLVRYIKRIDGVDTYDNNISYNPFLLWR